MNKIGLHIGYWWGSGRENDIFDMLELCAAAKLDVIELTPAWLVQLGSDGRKRFRQRLEELGMSATINGGSEFDLADDDAAKRAKGADYFRRVLELMPEIGSSVWSGLNYSAWLRKPSAPLSMDEKKRVCALSIDSLKTIMPTAEAVGVDYCFEVVNRFEQFMFNTSREAVAFAEAVGSPRAKILLDVYHMNIEEDDIADAILYAAKAQKLGHLHIGESNRRIPGTGKTHIDWDGIARAIAGGGYTGCLIMEPFVLATAHNAHRTCTWRPMVADTSVEALTRDAETGGRFLRSVLRNAGIKD